MSLRMCPRRRLISLSPRYLLTWQCRRLSTVSTAHIWMLLCRRSHTVLFLRTFLRRWVLAQLPRFLSTWLSRLLFAVLYHTILPHNYRSRSSLLDVSSLTILLIVRARHRYKAILVVPIRLHFLTLLRFAIQQFQPCQRRSRAHYGSTCLTAATTGSRRVCPASRSRY